MTFVIVIVTLVQHPDAHIMSCMRDHPGDVTCLSRRDVTCYRLRYIAVTWGSGGGGVLCFQIYHVIKDISKPNEPVVCKLHMYQNNYNINANNKINNNNYNYIWLIYRFRRDFSTKEMPSPVLPEPKIYEKCLFSSVNTFYI